MRTCAPLLNTVGLPTTQLAFTEEEPAVVLHRRSARTGTGRHSDLPLGRKASRNRVDIAGRRYGL